MSAETRRRAAALMRERAERATSGPWHIQDPGMGKTKEIFGPIGALPGQGRQLPLAEQVFGRDAKHIASWHPAVALAVADWLDSPCPNDESPALAVARAYLGEFA